jgi:hypothetical protein
MITPKGTLKFSLKTKKKIERIPSYSKNWRRTVSIRSLTDGPLTYNPSIYSKNELDWTDHKTTLPGERESIETCENGSLENKLGTPPICTWCNNTLTLEFNSYRSGFQITCSYCGMTGPCESEANSAIEAFMQVAII